MTPVTEKQFEQATLTLVFTKAAVDKSAISDKTGQLKFCHSTGRINDSNIKFVVYRQELKNHYIISNKTSITNDKSIYRK